MLRKQLSGCLCGVLLASAAVAPGARAATLVGDYQFQGSLASAPGTAGLALTDIAAGNAFQSDSVFGVSRQVGTFPLHNGYEMTPVAVDANTYSVVTTFRLDAVGGAPAYRRILDVSGGTPSENGLYVAANGTFNYYFSVAPIYESANAVFAAGTWATLALVRHVPGGATKGYVNGSLVLDANIAQGIPGGSLRFFKDAAAGTTDEDSAGAVSCIRVLNGLLTAGEVCRDRCQPELRAAGGEAGDAAGGVRGGTPQVQEEEGQTPPQRGSREEEKGEVQAKEAPEVGIS